MVLDLIYEGDSDISSISRRLGVQESAVMGCISLLLEKGYLEKIAPCQKDSGKCGGCPFSGSSATILLISEKGLKHLGKPDCQDP